MGPLQFLCIGFDGNRFTGEIMPELRSLCERDLIRVVDLVFVKKDAAGDITNLEVAELPADDAIALQSLHYDAGDWFAQDDIVAIGESLASESSVALVLLEHLWAQPLTGAVKRANGRLIVEGMVPRDVIDEVEVMLKAS